MWQLLVQGLEYQLPLGTRLTRANFVCVTQANFVSGEQGQHLPKHGCSRVTHSAAPKFGLIGNGH